MAKQKNSKTAKESNTTKILEPRGSATDIGSRLAATPFAFMKRFGEEMDRLFEDFGFGPGLITTAGREFGPGMWAPQVEMFERDGNLVVRADLPGLTKDDVNVPELVLIGGTRVAIGVGVGLLLKERLNKDQRKAAGLALLIVGALSTIPLALEVLSSKG